MNITSVANLGQGRKEGRTLLLSSRLIIATAGFVHRLKIGIKDWPMVLLCESQVPTLELWLEITSDKEVRDSGIHRNHKIPVSNSYLNCKPKWPDKENRMS
jgi:hypothetical protein